MSVWQSMFSTAVNDSKTKDSSVLGLRISDIVSHDLMDYLVVGQCTYNNDSGSSWTDYQLEGDGDTWLVYEKDLDLVAIYKPADLDLNGKPPKEIKYQGIMYSLCDFGRAGITEVNGQAVNNRGSAIRYHQYHDKTGGYAIFVEDCDGKLEISCGYCIKPQEIRLIRKLRAIY